MANGNYYWQCRAVLDKMDRLPRGANGDLGISPLFFFQMQWRALLLIISVPSSYILKTIAEQSVDGHSWRPDPQKFGAAFDIV